MRGLVDYLRWRFGSGGRGPLAYRMLGARSSRTSEPVAPDPALVNDTDVSWDDARPLSSLLT